MVWSMVNPYRARYSVADENIVMCGYLSVYMLLPLSTGLIMCGERVITYLEDVG